MKWQKAYTLIEILVSLTIIGILFGFGYVSYRDFNRRQALAGVVKQVQGDLRLAQQQALSGQKPSDLKCNPPEFLDGIDFAIASAGYGGTYVIEAACSGGVVSDPPIKSVTLGPDISITSSLTPIRFKVLGNGNNIPSDQNATITLSQKATGSTAVITITPGGEIK